MLWPLVTAAVVTANAWSRNFKRRRARELAARSAALLAGLEVKTPRPPRARRTIEPAPAAKRAEPIVASGSASLPALAAADQQRDAAAEKRRGAASVERSRVPEAYLGDSTRKIERMIDVYIAQAMQATGTRRAEMQQALDALPEDPAQLTEDMVVELSRVFEIDPAELEALQAQYADDPVIEPPPAYVHAAPVDDVPVPIEDISARYVLMPQSPMPRQRTRTPRGSATPVQLPSTGVPEDAFEDREDTVSAPQRSFD